MLANFWLFFVKILELIICIDEKNKKKIHMIKDSKLKRYKKDEQKDSKTENF